MTLNEIVDKIAADLREPNNYSLKENLKITVKYWRAEFLRRDITRNGISPYYLQSMVFTLSKVDKLDNCLVEDGCVILKTDIKLPESIRTASDFDFKYVGEVGGGKPFTYTEFEELQFTAYNKYTARVNRWALKNGYGYVFPIIGQEQETIFLPKFKFLEVESPFVNPEEIRQVCGETFNCLTMDDETFPIPTDMLRAISEGIIKNQLEIKEKPKDEVVPLERES